MPISQIMQALEAEQWEEATKKIQHAGQLEIQCADDNGITALHIATRQNNIAIVRLLLIHGAHINACATIDNISHTTSLHITARWGFTPLTQLLLLWQANSTLQNSASQTALDLAYFYGHTDIAALLTPAPNTPPRYLYSLATIYRCNAPFMRNLIAQKLLELCNSTPEMSIAREQMGKYIKNKASILHFPDIKH